MVDLAHVEADLGLEVADAVQEVLLLELRRGARRPELLEPAHLGLRRRHLPRD